MASCGIEKYDNLPARIGGTDVDALRAHYSFLNSAFPIPFREKRLRKIEMELEFIYKRYYEVYV